MDTDRRPKPTSSLRAAFTLVEILIVVIILGVLAAIVVPAFGSATEEARRGAFIESLRAMADVCDAYRAREGTYPPDGSSGILPPELSDWIRVSDFESGTPIGGVWDTELNDNGVEAAIGVHFNGVGQTRDNAYMALIDEVIDDGDLATGGFRSPAPDRYYRVLAE